MPKTLALLAFFIITLNSSQAQNNSSKSNSCFEWSFGVNHAFYDINEGHKFRSRDVNYDTISGIQMRTQTGFTGGVMRNFAITGISLIRVDANLGIHKNDIDYAFESGEIQSFPFNTTDISSSIFLVQNFGDPTAMSRKKTYPYGLAGVTYAYELRLNKEQNNRVIDLRSDDLKLSLGIGGRFYTSKKHLGAIELKYSAGFFNLYQTNFDIYNGSLEQIRKHTLTLSFNFS